MKKARRKPLGDARISCMAAATLCGLITFPALAEVEQDLTLSGFAGIEYDDNVNVIVIDEATRLGDYAAVFGAGLKYDVDFNKDTSVSASYTFRQSELFEFSQFDLQLHGTNLTVTQDLGRVSIGGSHQFFLSQLGERELLTLNRFSPFLTYAPSKKVFLRGAYTYKSKDLVDFSERDSDTHAGDILAFYFLDGTDTFLTGAYRYEDEDATADEFDFEAHIVRVGLDTRLPVGIEKNRFEIDLEYEDRDYSSFSPTIGEIRDDERFTLDVSWEIPFGRYFNLTSLYTYRDFKSNFPGANFEENVFRMTIGVEY